MSCCLHADQILLKLTTQQIVWPDVKYEERVTLITHSGQLHLNDATYISVTCIVIMFQLKCEQYWPEIGQEVMHDCISVLNVSCQVFADFTFRVLNVTCKGKTRKVS